MSAGRFHTTLRPICYHRSTLGVGWVRRPWSPSSHPATLPWSPVLPPRHLTHALLTSHRLSAPPSSHLLLLCLHPPPHEHLPSPPTNIRVHSASFRWGLRLSVARPTTTRSPTGRSFRFLIQQAQKVKNLDIAYSSFIIMFIAFK